MPRTFQPICFTFYVVHDIAPRISPKGVISYFCIILMWNWKSMLLGLEKKHDSSTKRVHITPLNTGQWRGENMPDDFPSVCLAFLSVWTFLEMRVCVCFVHECALGPRNGGFSASCSCACGLVSSSGGAGRLGGKHNTMLPSCAVWLSLWSAVAMCCCCCGCCFCCCCCCFCFASMLRARLCCVWLLCAANTVSRSRSLCAVKLFRIA